MKILIGSLLFATAIFINLPELNSSPQPPKGSSSQHNAVSGIALQAEAADGLIAIFLLGERIDVYIATFGSQHLAIGCEVFQSQLHIPTAITRGSINFITQAVFRQYGDSLIKIVIYVEEFTSTNRRLLGAKLPPAGHESPNEDEPGLLDPDESIWFITYGGIDYVITADPKTELVRDIRLRRGRNQRPNDDYIKKNWNKYRYLHFGDLYILVFYKNNQIVGAASDPFWNFRPGELFANRNPYREEQKHLQINAEPNHPIEPIPDHHQIHDQHHNHDSIHAYHQADASQHFPYHIPDQQHHFEHPNAYLQQNLYQGPYHDPPHTFDPNQIAYHQQNVGPSQHNQQQDIYIPAHYDPRINWHNPSYNPHNP